LIRFDLEIETKPGTEDSVILIFCFLDSRLPATILRENGGARRDRTDDLLLAKQALSQLSYGPDHVIPRETNSRLRIGGPGKI
jgi:hypothetical protein